MSSKFILFLVFLGLSGCATVEQPSPQTTATTQPLAPIPGIPHVVIQGETLWRISKTYQIDLEDIIKANRFSDSTVITPGQTIIIPKGATGNISPQTNFSPKEETEFIWPAKGKIITHFKEKSNGVANKGIDILADGPEDILASRSGKVIFVGRLTGYAKTIIIDHEDDFSTIYCTNASTSVKMGDEIKQGMTIATTGDLLRKGSGSLHFEIRKKNKPQNPLYFLS